MHSTPQCKKLMEILKQLPNFPSQQGQGKGGVGGGKNKKGKRDGRGGGKPQQQQQEERAPKRGRNDPQQDPKN